VYAIPLHHTLHYTTEHTTPHSTLHHTTSTSHYLYITLPLHHTTPTPHYPYTIHYTAQGPRSDPHLSSGQRSLYVGYVTDAFEVHHTTQTRGGQTRPSLLSCPLPLYVSLNLFYGGSIGSLAVLTISLSLRLSLPLSLRLSVSSTSSLCTPSPSLSLSPSLCL
jgi:hypothetical protein